MLNKRIVTTNELIEAAKQLQEMGAQNVIISRGKEGAIFVSKDGDVYENRGLKGICISSVGSGDSMVAGFVAAYLKCQNYEEAFKLAVACGCAPAFSDDLAEIEMIKKCYELVEIKK